MLRFFVVVFTVLLTHADCRLILTTGMKVNEFESGLRHAFSKGDIFYLRNVADARECSACMAGVLQSATERFVMI